MLGSLDCFQLLNPCLTYKRRQILSIFFDFPQQIYHGILRPYPDKRSIWDC